MESAFVDSVVPRILANFVIVYSLITWSGMVLFGKHEWLRYGEVFSIIFGLICGFLLFPSPDFSKSLLVGIMLSKEIFPTFVSQSLLFLSFLIATLGPAIVIMSYDSFKR